MTKLVPMTDRVIVKKKEVSKMSSGGIHLVDTAQDREQNIEGEVLAVGQGKPTEAGTLRALSVKVGDVIVFNRFGATEIKVGGESLLVIKEDDILCVLEGE